MADQAFYWIGVGASLTVAAIIVLAALAAIYAWLIHDRFYAILFRKGQRRISIASWYNTRLMSDEFFTADDFPIGPRPFYLSYRVGNRRLFVMAGRLEPHRHAVIRGEHPERRPS